MLKQLHRLMELSARPSIMLHVVRLVDGQHAGMSGHFTILQFAEEGATDYVFFDTLIQNIAFSDDERVVEGHRAAFKELQRMALPPDESTAFVDNMIEEL